VKWVIKNYVIYYLCAALQPANRSRHAKLYERIGAKGKRKKLVLTAVCTKPLKQAFAIAKLGFIFDVAYKNTRVKN
jgi:hypothetical protein